MASKKHADVIRAWLDGAQIQYRLHDCDEWVDSKGGNLAFDDYHEYRVKPEPEVRLDGVCLNEKEAALLYGMLNNIAAAAAAIEHNCASIPSGMVHLTSLDASAVHYTLYAKLRNVIRSQLELPELP